MEDRYGWWMESDNGYERVFVIGPREAKDGGDIGYKVHRFGNGYHARHVAEMLNDAYKRGWDDALAVNRKGND